MAKASNQGTGREARRSGFSLLELLLVLVGITVLAAVSIWAFFARAEVTLENAARLLVEDLHLAQSRALFLRAPVEFRFDADGFGYQVSDSTGQSSGVEALDFLGRRYDVDASGAMDCRDRLRVPAVRRTTDPRSSCARALDGRSTG
ncbi:MAG: hypothetical protein IPJ77_24740 [Planctomycetes bacterium]|nr:hypothetical protein [Planctomycetota bacterium]